MNVDSAYRFALRRGSLLWYIRNLLFLVALALTVYFGIFDTPVVPKVLKPLNRPDLVLHFLAFAACAFVCPRAGGRQHYLLLLLLGLAGAIELVQLNVDQRSASFSDFVAGGLGIGCGWLASRATGRLARAFT